jgi:hypothetical protein
MSDNKGFVTRRDVPSGAEGNTPRGLRPSAMPRRSLGVGLLLLMAAATLAGAFGRDAFAQAAAGSDDPPPAAATADSSVDLAPSDVLSNEPEKELTSAERVARATQFVATIEVSSQSILRQLQTARKDRDVVRVLCLNDKLNQVDVALRSAQDRVTAVRSAAERGDADRTRHEYTVLEVLNDRVRILVNESNQCIGEETGFIGEAEVSVSIDPNLPNPEAGFDSQSDAPPVLPEISSPIE